MVLNDPHWRFVHSANFEIRHNVTSGLGCVLQVSNHKNVCVEPRFILHTYSMVTCLKYVSTGSDIVSYLKVGRSVDNFDS